MATYLSAEKDCDFGRDRISGLPNDIILTFLSPMGMKEAAKTSILSKRWRYLWAQRTHLDFDHFHVFPESDVNICMCSFTGSEKRKYINWVNQVVDLHCSSYIDTFRVCFTFDSSDAIHFDRWVKFALSRKVKNLELNSHSCEVVYTLGFDILKPSVCITSLTSLHLNHVDVSGDFIEFLLSKCHHLERLYIGFSPLLVRLKVIGLVCKLKQLTIHSCSGLEELEIDADDLMYFDFIGRKPSTNLVFRRLPMLVEAAFGGTCFESPIPIFHRISHLAAQISKLSLELMYYKFPAEALPKFRNLKHLNLVVKYSETDPIDTTRLLEACPVLQELKLEFYWFTYILGMEHYFLDIVDMPGENDVEVDLDDFDYRETERMTHPNLKQLHVSGFGGCNDVDTILSIVRSACNLETLICDPNRYVECSCNTDDVIETSRARAYKLVKLIPRKISIVII